MRCDQIIGLNSRGKAFLEKNVLMDTVTITRKGKIIKETQQYAYEYTDKYAEIGMCDDKIQFRKYLLKDGSCVYEYAQCTPWASGPNYYLALKTEEGEPILETLWEESEII